MVDKNSFEPLYVQIQKALQERIRSGDLPPGSQIPSEHELATTFHVSRMTARKAIERMVDKGLLFRQQGKGTFVVEDVLSYDFSSMISFSRTLRARGYRVDTEVLRQEVIPGPSEIVEKLRLLPGSELIIIKRLRFVSGDPVAIHTSFLDCNTFLPLLDVDLERESLLTALEEQCGCHIAYSKDEIRASRASAEESKLLEIEPGSPILEEKGVAYDITGEPTRFIWSIYRGDKFSINLDSTRESMRSLMITENEASSLSERR